MWKSGRRSGKGSNTAGAGPRLAGMGDSQLTLLYTANIAGRLDSLPRLFSHIQKIRAEVKGPVSLLDLGGTCDPSVWECAVTADRAVLFVLDAMGYDVACLTGMDCARMDSNARHKLIERTTTALCGLTPAVDFPSHAAWKVGTFHLVCSAEAANTAAGGVDLTVSPGHDGSPVELVPEERRLYLPVPDDNTLGIAIVTFDGKRIPSSVKCQFEPVPASTRPDATVAAAVDFVRDEARHYQRIQQRGAHETG